jgi:hypothetical protein
VTAIAQTGDFRGAYGLLYWGSMSALRCPNCRAPIGDTGISSTVMGSLPAQHRRCPGCDMRLVRNPESLIAELREWRAAEDEPTHPATF